MIEGMRADTWEWSLYIDGINFGVFDAKEGGDVDSDDTTFKPGGMNDPYSLGGSRVFANLTFRRNYRLGRDHPTSQRLINGVGKAPVRAVGQPLDHNAAPWGTPFTYNCILKRVGFPTHDSNANDASLLEIELTVSQAPTGMSA